MLRKRHTPEQIISKLREAEVGLAGDQTVPEVCRTLGVAEQTYYRWRNDDGSVPVIWVAYSRVSPTQGVSSI